MHSRITFYANQLTHAKPCRLAQRRVTRLILTVQYPISSSASLAFKHNDHYSKSHHDSRIKPYVKHSQITTTRTLHFACIAIFNVYSYLVVLVKKIAEQSYIHTHTVHVHTKTSYCIINSNYSMHLRCGCLDGRCVE